MFSRVSGREVRLNTRQDFIAVFEEDKSVLKRQQIGACDPYGDVDGRSELSSVCPETQVFLRKMNTGVGKPRPPLVVAPAADMIGMWMRDHHRVDPCGIDPGAHQVVLQSAAPVSEQLGRSDARLEDHRLSAQ